jgi:hypothetical protein
MLSEQKKNWYESNKERILATRKGYYLENKEKIKKRVKKYKKNNPDKVKKWQKNGYEKNSLRHKKWYKVNKSRVIKKATKWNNDNLEIRRGISRNSKKRQIQNISESYAKDILVNIQGFDRLEVECNPELIQIKKAIITYKRLKYGKKGKEYSTIV